MLSVIHRVDRDIEVAKWALMTKRINEDLKTSYRTNTIKQHYAELKSKGFLPAITNPANASPLQPGFNQEGIKVWPKVPFAGNQYFIIDDSEDEEDQVAPEVLSLLYQTTKTSPGAQGESSNARKAKAADKSPSPFAGKSAQAGESVAADDLLNPLAGKVVQVGEDQTGDAKGKGKALLDGMTDSEKAEEAGGGSMLDDYSLQDEEWQSLMGPAMQRMSSRGFF